MLRAFIVCLAVLLPLHAKPPLPDITGKVVGVYDGDTITLLTGGRVEVKIRLEGIDAPEANQAFGAKSKAALSKLVFGKSVTVHPKGNDRYRRTLGRVEVAGVDVNLQMVKDGMAWQYTAYSKGTGACGRSGSGKGRKAWLVDRSAPVPPWVFRKAGK